MNGRFLGSLVLLAVIGAATAASKPEGGRLLKTDGEVMIDRGGQTLRADKGEVILQGDTLRSGADGKAQWWMQDDSLFVLPPNSTIHIDEYQSPRGKDSGSGRSFISLLRGAMRTVTGLIAKNNPANYRITTPVATMGVRGTDYSLVLCQNDCSSRLKKGDPPLPNGLYLKLDKGAGSLCNSGGCMDFSAGQGAVCGYAASSNQKPTQLPKCPNVFVYFDHEMEFDFDQGDLQQLRESIEIREPAASPG